MSSYFPLLPNLKSKMFDVLLETSVTLSNYPNNILFDNFSFKKEHMSPIYYYVFYLENNKWHKHSKIKCEFGELIEIKRSELNISSKKLIIIFPSFNEFLSSQLKTIPAPLSLKKDKCFVADRCSFNFSIGQFSSSYQGEYPYRLASAKRGSFFSFDSLSLGNKNIDSYIYLINIKKEANDKDDGELCFYNPEENKLIKKIKVSSNTSRFYNMREINALKKSSDTLIFITCKTLTFIPIFVNILKTNSGFELSVEHTHPPSELFWGKQKFIASNKLKKNWIF